MTLDLANVGTPYRVAALQLEGMAGRRLEALGLTDGTPIEVLNKKKNGAVIFKVRGTRLAIGRNIAHSIVVKEA